MPDGPARDAVLTAYASSLIRVKTRQLSRKPGFRRSDEDDLVQELTIALIEKSHLFDPTRGAASTFADRVIRTKVAMLLRDRSRLKRAAGLRAQSLESGVSHSDNTSLWDSLTSNANEWEAVEQGDLKVAIARAIESLPADLQEISRRLKTDAVAAVARDMRISRRQVRNAVERIRAHFVNQGFGDFFSGGQP